VKNFAGLKIGEVRKMRMIVRKLAVVVMTLSLPRAKGMLKYCKLKICTCEGTNGTIRVEVPIKWAYVNSVHL